MRNFVDIQSVTRKGQLSRLTMYAGLVISIIAVILVFRDPAYFVPTLIAVIIGSLMSQVGAVYYGRFGRSPRIDEVLTSGLKGLDDHHAFYQYYLKVDHVLFTPSGVFALFPNLEEGKIVWEDGNWIVETQKRFPIPRTARKKLGRVQKEAAHGVERVEKQLSQLLADADVEVRPLLVFIHPETHIHTNGESLPATHLKKLKSTLMNMPRLRGLDRESMNQLTRKLGAEELPQ